MDSIGAVPKGLILLFVVVPLCATVVILLLAINRKLKCPEKSFFFCFVNEALGPLRFFRLSIFKDKFDFESCCKKAMKVANRKYGVEMSVESWGKAKDFDFMDNYNTMLSTNTWKSMRFTNLGWFMAKKEMDSVLIRRLMFQRYLKLHPEVLNVPVVAPVFIIGLPRTGTTWLSRCLAQDPNVNAPQMWELLRPVPDNMNAVRDSPEMEADRKKRFREVKQLLEMRKGLGDSAMDHIHEVKVDNHEECLWCMSDDLPIQMHELYTDYMEPQAFFGKMDEKIVARTYEYYKKQLQLLAYQKEKDPSKPRRFLLKSPLHIFYMKGLAAAFPDAKVIWTHRKPENAVPSMGSLLKSLHQLYYEPECRDDHALGKKLYKITEEYLEKCPRDIEESNLDCCHVHYEDTTGNTVETIKNIYKHFGWEFTEEYRVILENFIANDKKVREDLKKKQGNSEVLHTYSPEEFGLNAEDLRSNGYKVYLDKYCKKPSK